MRICCTDRVGLVAPRMSCRQGWRGVAGFTLVEMMVVMVLLGMIAGMTLPAMQRWHDALLARSEASTIVEALQAAAFDAGVQKQDLVLDGKSFVVGQADDSGAPVQRVRRASADTIARVRIGLPPGWQVGRTVTAVFLADGLCSPGLVALESARGTRLLFAIQGPICRVEWAPDRGNAGG